MLRLCKLFYLCENESFSTVRHVGVYSCAGCLETPPAFLEAVPSAWTVTRLPVIWGCLIVVGISFQIRLKPPQAEVCIILCW